MNVLRLFFRASALLSLLLVFNLESTAQDKIRVSGTVLDDEKRPLVSVTVIGNDREAGAYTDEFGKYELLLTRQDTLRVLFTFPSFQDSVVLIPNPVLDAYELNIAMNPYTTAVVVVKTDKIAMSIDEVTNSVDLVDNETVNQFADNDIQSAMINVPGVTIYDGQPSIRGSSGYTYGAGSRVLTLLNGLPMISANRNSVSFSMLPTDNIQQIEVYKGASSVLYGAGAMGGVINVITDDPVDTPRTVIRGGMSWYDRPANDTADFDGRSAGIIPNVHFFHSRKIRKNFDFTAQVDLIYDSGYRQDEFERRFRGMTMMKYHIPVKNPKIKDLYIGLNLQASIDSSGTVLGGSAYPQGILVPGSGFLSLQNLFRYSIDPKIYLETARSQLTYQGRSFLQEDLISTGQSGISNLYYNEVQYLYKATEWFSFVTGVSHQRAFVKAAATFGEATSDQAGAYLQMRFKLFEKLNILLGARWQYETVQGDTSGALDSLGERTQEAVVRQRTINEPIFRVGLNYNAWPGGYLRGSFGQAIRSPGVAERYTTTQAGPITVIPAPNIQVEEGYTSELGIRQLFTLANGKLLGFLDVSAFFMRFNNMVEFYVDVASVGSSTGGLSVPFTAQNISEAQVTGVEANMNMQYNITPDAGINFSGGVTFIEPVDLGGDETFDGDDSASVIGDYVGILLLGGTPPTEAPDDRPRTLKYRNKVLVRSSTQFFYKHWAFTVNYRYTSHMINVDKVFLIDPIFPGVTDFRAANNNGWHELDFILAYNRPKYTISLHMFNALNTEYMTIPGTLGEQRRFAIQGRINL